MKTLISILIAAVLISCVDSDTSRFEDKEQTIELSYIAWACDCANWATINDIDKYASDGDTLAALSVFIEPAKESLALPDTLGYNGDIIAFTGHFYKEKGFPQEYHSNKKAEKAKVFRYTSYRVIKSNYIHADIKNTEVR